MMNSILKLVLQSFLLTIALTGCGGGDTPPSNGGGELPTINFSASKTEIAQGESITLTWSVQNADNCQASGAWAGSKTLADSQIVSGVMQNSDYTLSCEGSAGKSTKTVSVTVVVSGDKISGTVDSSYIDNLGQNTIYVFQGADATPDDYDGGADDPIQAVPVTQVENSCSWQYSIGLLPAGDYTLAFTTDAASDVKGVDNAIVFDKVVSVTKVADTGLVQNFMAKNILHVGSGKTYPTVKAAVGAANPGDVIEIDAGTYVDDVVGLSKNNLTLRGVGGLAHMQSINSISNGKAIWVTSGNNIKVENIEFSGAKVIDENGAGIRLEGSNTTICNSYFHDNENGVMGTGNNLLIEYSEFNHNGVGGAGYTHNIYIVNGSKFTFRYSYSHHANIGHNLKSRAQENYILYNRLMDEETGLSSYVVDIPNGGKTYLIGNLIQQGPNVGNSTIVSYGAEGLSNPSSELYMVNNTIVNDRNSGTFVYINGSTSTSKLTNNIFLGNGTVKSGPGDMLSNLITTNGSILVDRAGYDYHLVPAAVTAINQGSDPGTTGSGMSLQPMYEYTYPTSRTVRAVDAQIDIGAYEYK